MVMPNVKQFRMINENDANRRTNLLLNLRKIKWKLGFRKKKIAINDVDDAIKENHREGMQNWWLFMCCLCSRPSGRSEAYVRK